jgi:molybdopterin-guanine dinucleotide biosynthesis protein B
MLPPLVLAVAGHSGSGKTSLIERLMPVLSAGGLRCGYLKAGAEEAGPADARDRHELPLREARREIEAHRTRAILWNLREVFRGCDLLLVEGMRASSFPKILINRPGNPRGVLSPELLPKIALHLRLETPQRDWNEPVMRAAGLVRELLGGAARRNSQGLVGAVLAGGRSSRMGEDKARIPLRGVGTGARRSGPRGAHHGRAPLATRSAPGASPGASTWLERAFLLLAERCEPSIIVGRIAEGPDLPSLRRPADCHLDLRPRCGLLGGLETGLTLARGSAVLALPCDIPDLPGEVLDRLLAERDRVAEGTVFIRRPVQPVPARAASSVLLGPESLEPAITILEARALAPLRAFLDAGRREATAFFETLALRRVPLPPTWCRGFGGRNTPQDRRAYEAGEAEYG